MRIPRLITTIISFAVLVSTAGAQVILPGGRQTETRGRSGLKSEADRTRIMGTTMDVHSIPIQSKSFDDTRLKELETELNERSWNSEVTAWQRACDLDSKSAYEKYCAMYPNGPHKAEATKRLIDIKVNDAFNSNHGSLPTMKQVKSDDDSPTTTIVIENDTGLPLTVMFSGEESRNIIIPSGSRRTVTVKNGQYRIAASVPPATIRPFAGEQGFYGGQYETGFIIVSGP